MSDNTADPAYGPGYTWSASLALLRSRVSEPAALANAARLNSARRRWNNVVGRRDGGTRSGVHPSPCRPADHRHGNYVCFHYQFEHAGDHDKECTVPGCPAALLGAAAFADPIRDALASELLEDLRRSDLALGSYNVRLDRDGPGVIRARFDGRRFLVTVRDDPQAH